MMFKERLKELTNCLLTCSYDSALGPLAEGRALERAHQLLRQCHERSGIVYVIGNGGSAGIASHFSNDLMKALKISSHTLYDTNLLTCLANDIGYENVFSYQLERSLAQKDLLVAISSSGKSPNILKAVAVAQQRKVPVITLSGFDAANPLRQMGELNFWIDRKDYGLVETAHFFLLHTIVDTWNKQVIEYAKIYRRTRTSKN